MLEVIQIKSLLFLNESGSWGFMHITISYNNSYYYYEHTEKVVKLINSKARKFFYC